MENSGKSALGLDANIVAGLCYVANLVCYLGIILAIITLVTDKVNKLARFHAAQSLLLIAANIVLLPVYFVAGIVMAMNSSVTTILGGLLMLVVAVVGLAIFVFFIISAIKAFQGQIYKVPVVGNFADKFSA